MEFLWFFCCSWFPWQVCLFGGQSRIRWRKSFSTEKTTQNSLRNKTPPLKDSLIILSAINEVTQYVEIPITVMKGCKRSQKLLIRLTSSRKTRLLGAPYQRAPDRFQCQDSPFFPIYTIRCEMLSLMPPVTVEIRNICRDTENPTLIRIWDFIQSIGQSRHQEPLPLAARSIRPNLIPYHHYRRCIPHENEDENPRNCGEKSSTARQNSVSRHGRQIGCLNWRVYGFPFSTPMRNRASNKTVNVVYFLR